ncbi:MAG: FAD binding domain-containing protein [Bacillota bacterium]
MRINEYHRATSLDDAYERLNEDKKNTVIGGGGWLKLSSKTIPLAIGLEGLGLDTIEDDGETITIGSMTTLNQMADHPSIKALYSGIIPEAIHRIMGLSLRNIVTIGGTIMGKYPFSDLLTPLLMMECTLEFHKEGHLALPAFLNQKGRMDDILVSLKIRKKEGKGYFKKVAKTALDFAVLNVAVAYDDDGYKIAVGSRPSRAVYAQDAMAMMNEADDVRKAKFKAAKKASEELSFGTNHRASETYRRKLAEVYVRRGLKEVNGDAD